MHLILIALATNFAFLFYYNLFSPYPAAMTSVFRQTPNGILIGLVILSVVSILSKAINGSYKISELARLAYVAIFGSLFLATNFLGLRWLLPSFLLSGNLNEYFVFLWFGYLLYRIIYLITDIRKTYLFVVILLTLIAAIEIQKYIPVDGNYRYWEVTTSPPRPQLLESKPISTEEFSALLIEQVK